MLITVGGIAKDRRPSSWALISLVLYLKMMPQLVPRQIYAMLNATDLAGDAT